MPTGATAKPDDNLGPRRLSSRTSLAEPVRRPPFAWQEGRQLWILDGQPGEWILAELRFEPRTCRYFEIRRTRYRWPREATGALLGRTFAGGHERAQAAARELAAWMIRSGESR